MDPDLTPQRDRSTDPQRDRSTDPQSDPGPCGQPADDGPEEQTWTAAAHASHFLQRALRCRGEDLERAMAMYHHSELMRRLVPELLADQPEVLRAAIPLRDEPPAPHVVVTRDGRFVTCLDEDMAHDLAVLPRATIAERLAEEDAARGRLQRSRVQLRRLRSVTLMKALIAGYGHLSREMVEIVLLEPTTYLAGTLQVFADTYDRWVRLCARRPFARNPTAVYRCQLEAEATCRMTLPLLGVMDAQLLTDYLELFLQTNSTLEIDIISALSRHSGGGEALLRAALQPQVAEATRNLCASYVGTHFLYHPAQARGLLPRARALPQLERDTEFMKTLRERYDEWLALSEEELLTYLEGERRKEVEHLPPAARHYRLSSDDYYRTLHRQFSVALLYPPAAVAGGMQQSWARRLRDSRPPQRARSGAKPVRNEAPKIGRNDPCPCQSGRKHKQCCLLRPRGADAPAAEPVQAQAQAQAEAPMAEAPA